MRLTLSVRHLAVLFALWPAAAAAQVRDQLEVTFQMAQYTDTGSKSFSLGCTASPPTERDNYVLIAVAWLEDDSGNYVTTLFRWGRTYPYNLKRWALSSRMAVDGMTESTPTSADGQPAQIFAGFNGGDGYATGVVDVSSIPDGTYRLRLETTQCELAGGYRSGEVVYYGPDATFTFTKGRSDLNQNLGSDAPFNNVTIDYQVAAGNDPPGAFAGPDQELMPSLTPADESTVLVGVVDDEAAPPTVLWELVDNRPGGPGTAPLIVSPTSAQTAVDFTAAGIFTFRLTATDGGGLTSSDEVTIFVNAHFIKASADAEISTYLASGNIGIIENAGPWAWAYGPAPNSGCPGGETNIGRGFFRFDVSGLQDPVTFARLLLPWAEGTPSATVGNDYYLLTDAQEDWNGSNSDPDVEASVTFNNSIMVNHSTNQIVPLAAEQYLGSSEHTLCPWRHAYTNPYQAPAPGSDCPGMIVADNLDLTNIDTYDANGIWDVFAAPRELCNNGQGIGTRENLIGPTLVAVEHWQATVNVAPVADAGADAVVVDLAPTGAEFATFDGGGSTDDVGIVAYEWREGGVLLGSDAAPDGVTAPLALGPHTVELTVRDGGGLSDTDEVEVLIDDRFTPNASSAAAAVIDGTATGRLYDDLYVGAPGPGGDWFAIDLVAGSDLTAVVALAGGDLDLHLYDDAVAPLDDSTGTTATETVGGSALAAGRYYLQVEAVGGAGSTYELTLTVTGPTLAVSFDPSSAVETAGLLAGAGTVSAGAPTVADLEVTLSVTPAGYLTFPTNPVTIPGGSASVDFDVTVVDDPGGAPDANRTATIRASAAGYNQGSADFSILDDEATLLVVWNKTAENVAESGSPLVVLRAVLSSSSAGSVTVPFTLSGTATAGSDYSVQGGVTQLSITSGATEATLVLTVLDDAAAEGAETAVLTIGTPVGASPGTASVYTLTIDDDDSGGPGGSGGGAGSGGGGSGGDGGGGNPTPVGCACGAAGGFDPSWLLLLGLAVGWPLRRRLERSRR